MQCRMGGARFEYTPKSISDTTWRIPSGSETTERYVISRFPFHPFNTAPIMPMPGSTSAQAVWTDSGDDEGSTTLRSRAFSLVSRSSDGVPSHSSFSPSSSASSSDEESDAGTKDGRHHLSRDELADYKFMLRDLDRQEAAHRVTRAGPSNASSISTMGRMNDRRDPTSRAGKDQDSRDLDDRWPLRPDELDEASLPLGDIVKAVAREMTSGRHLSLQMPPPCPDNVTEDNQVEWSEIDTELEGEGTPLPSDLAESTRALVDKLLVNLAAMRPKLSRKKRKRQPPISWEGVIQAGMLMDGHEE